MFSSDRASNRVSKLFSSREAIDLGARAFRIGKRESPAVDS